MKETETLVGVEEFHDTCMHCSPQVYPAERVFRLCSLDCQGFFDLFKVAEQQGDLMSVMDLERERDEEAGFQLWIGNEKPLDAEDLGRLVRELAVDYRRQTEGRLVLVRLELGSTFVEFLDQAVVYTNYVAAPLVLMDAAGRMAKFFKYLSQQLALPEETKAEVLPMEPSTIRLLEVAANAGADLRLSRGSGRTREVVELSFPEVSKRKKKAKRKAKKQSGKASGNNVPSVHIEELAERIRAQAISNPNQLESLIGIVIDLLKTSGASYLLATLAQNLEAQNLWHAASIVRSHIEGRGNVTIRRDD